MSDQGEGEGDRRRPVSPSGAQLTALGLSIGIAFALPTLLGVGADALLHSSPLAFLIGLLLGLIGAASLAVSQFRRYL